MKTTKLPMRLWLQAGSAVLCALMFAATLWSRAWIEVVLRVDPDHGSGAVERAIVIGCAIASLVAAASGVRTLRRARSVAATEA